MQPEACVSLWPTEECAWSIAEIWRGSDVVLRAIYFTLALLLGYTIFVVLRFFHRYRLARPEFRESESDSGPESCSNGRRLVADLSRGLATLKAIGSAAPFLGLVGTSYGILAAFYSFGVSRSSLVEFLIMRLAATQISATLGILVAIPSILFHNILRALIERRAATLPRSNSTETDLRSFRFAQTLPLRKRFLGLPAFALVAVPIVACALMVYMGFRAYPMPTGLRVHMLPIGTLRTPNGSTDRVAISILSRRDGLPIVRVNSEEIPLDNLDEAVRARLRPLTNCHAYVETDSASYFTYVADVIDRMKTLHCQVFLLTTVPAPRAKIPIAHPHPLR